MLDARKGGGYDCSHIIKLLDNNGGMPEFGISANDLNIMDDIESWVRYQSRGEAIAAIGKAAHPYIISPSQLVSNLELGFVNQPKVCEESPLKLLSDKLSKYELTDVLCQVCLALALELSHDPVIRAVLREAAKNHPVCLTTEPTLKGNSELTTYHPNFMTKRLVKMPLHEIPGIMTYSYVKL